MKIDNFFYSIILAAAFLLCASPSFAHRVNVYAWLDNDHVIVECNFGKDRPAKNASVTILDSENRAELLKGKTNDAGVFTFTVPQVVREGHGLVINVNAGEGHRNEWTMEASELYAAASLTAGFDQAANDSAKQNRTQPKGDEPAATGSAAQPNIPLPQSVAPAISQPAISHEDMRKIVHDAVESQIAPVRQQLARQAAGGPSMTEIIGGIGWIMGIIGIILYFRSRRNS